MPGTLGNTIKDLGITTAVGLPAGLINAETDSMLNQGRAANWSSIKEQAVDYGVIGFALSGMTHGLAALQPRLPLAQPQVEPQAAHVYPWPET